MMTLFHGSIRKKLIVLVLLAAMPAFSVLLITEWLNRRHAVSEARKEATIFLNGFTEVQRRITDSTHTLLRTVASIPDIRNEKQEASQVILSTLLETNPIYTNVILVDTDGSVVAAGKDHETVKRLNFADRKQFKDAIRTKGFSSGEYVVGKSSKKSIFPFGMAVLDDNKDPSGVIIIGVNLFHYTTLFNRNDFPEDSLFGLCDHNGLRLFRHPRPDELKIGEPIKKDIFNAAASGRPGSIIGVTSEGNKRLIVFEALRVKEDQPPYMYMFMAFSYHQIQSEARAILYRVAITGLLSLSLTLLIVRFIGGRGIARRIEALTRMTRAFGKGERSIASGIDYSDGELGELARSFDTMTATLDEREKERNEALQELKYSEQRFREIIEDVSAISIQGYDEDRTVTFWNSASEILYGYTRQEALGKKLEDLIIPPHMRDDIIINHRRWLETDEKIPAGELVLVDKNGDDVPVFSSHIMHQTRHGKEMFCIDIDMKPLLQSETDRQQLMARLRQSQKMEAIGTLAGGIAHDFNNILSPIIGYTEILLYGMGDKDLSARESLGHIHASAMRARELVRQILTFSRQEKTEFRPVKIQTVLKEVIKLLQSTIPKKIEIKETIHTGCPAVFADETQLHQIIMNLATNAYHAMAESGGKLEFYLNEVDISHLESKKLGMAPGPMVCLSVKDTGIGMEPDLADKIFDPFFTTKEKGKGTGMGLSMVHGIVKNMNGGIFVTSTPGQGSEFKVYFPVQEYPMESTHGEEVSDLFFSKGDERILIVDDEPDVLSMEALALEQLGYTVQSTLYPLEALQIFKKHPHRFDLVITDMSMPKMSGEELAEKLVAVRPDIPVLLSTGFTGKNIPDITEKTGVKGIVMKPVILKELSAVLRRILEEADHH